MAVFVRKSIRHRRIRGKPTKGRQTQTEAHPSQKEEDKKTNEYTLARKRGTWVHKGKNTCKGTQTV